VPLPPDCRPCDSWFSRPFCHPSAWILAGLLVSIACSGGTDLLLPGDGEPAHIELEEGGGQSGRVGERLTDPLVFSVTDSRARPVEDARITFDLGSAGPEADVVPDIATTDANGMAEVMLVLGTRVGPQVVEARVLVGEEDEEPKTSVTIMALPENANGISAVSGDDQTAPAGSTLGQPLVVQVTDAFGNPISGVPITWTAPDGGSVSETSNVTDGDGRASVVRTLGPTAGTQTTLAASEESLAGSPVTFRHTATAGSVAGLSIVSGNEQTAVAGTELPGDLVVRLVDAAGNGVPGAAVTWVVGLGGGHVAPENTTTDEAGRTSTRWTLGPSPGENRVDAVVSGVGVANFRATGTASAPARLAVVTQPSGSARNGVPLERQPVVQLRDTQGSPANTPGVVITAQLSGGGGELLGTRQRATGPNGSAAFTDLAIAGAEGNRTLVFTASGYAGVTSSAIQVRPVPTTTSITSDSPDPSIAGGTVTVGFRVSSERLTPTGSVTVTALAGGANCTGPLQGGAGSCQMVLNRTGQRTLRATYSGSPGFNGSSDSESHRVDPAAPGNRPPDADYNWHCEGLSCDFVDRSRDSDGQVRGWSWNFGDGSPAVTQQNPTHTFAGPGNYTVTLTATDDDGASDASSATVDVEAPPPPPPGGTSTSITGDNPDPSAPGQAVTVSFSVISSSGTPTGVVRVEDAQGGGCTGNAPSGSCTYTPSGTGTRTITATYEGNASFNGSSASAQHTVSEPPPEPASTTTTITADNPDPSAMDELITVSFTVTSPSGTPSGTVQITDGIGGGCTGNAPSDSCSYVPSGIGPRTITATYEGNPDFEPSSASEPHTVNEPPPPPPAESRTEIISDEPDESGIGEPVLVQFRVESENDDRVPSGSVQVTASTDIASCTGTLNESGEGSCFISLSTPGSLELVATYSGDSVFSGSSDEESHNVSDGD
jgi:PKD repeat protein